MTAAGSSARPDAARGTGPGARPTYHGRSQLRAAPFHNGAVGGYVFLAGLSGGAMIVSTLAERAGHRGSAGRRGRRIAILAPTLGAALLVWDLHTPQRALNMLRVAKATSPMSIGTWTLLGFSAFTAPAALADLAADLLPGRAAPLRAAARLAAVPAAVLGGGMGTYTAALLAATSTPLWAAAARALAVRFASSSIVAGAGALALAERDEPTRRALDRVAVVALATEAVAAVIAHRIYDERGLGDARRSRPGRIETWGAHVAGTLVPLALKIASLGARNGGGGRRSALASALAVAGGATFRIAIMAAGDVTARDPRLSLGFNDAERGRRRHRPRIGDRVDGTVPRR